MELHEIEEIVLESEDVNELRFYQIKLVKMSGNMYKSINYAETINEQSELKSRLSLINSLKDICVERIKEVQKTQERFNHNFRMAAMTVLKKETYQKIKEFANMKRIDFKQLKTVKYE